MPSAVLSRPCTRCHGKKVTGKKSWPCKQCHGTGINPVSEKSQRGIEIVLKALRELTPSGCPEASTKEIFRYLRSVMMTGADLTLDSIIRILVYLKRDGLVDKHREGIEALWSLTEKGTLLCAKGAK
jgi:predicted transcriptional regulator